MLIIFFVIYANIIITTRNYKMNEEMSTFSGNGTIIDLALDAKSRMAYVATNLGLLYSVNIQLKAISLIKNISQQPVRALKLDRREGYILTTLIILANVNNYNC